MEDILGRQKDCLIHLLVGRFVFAAAPSLCLYPAVFACLLACARAPLTTRGAFSVIVRQVYMVWEYAVNAASERWSDERNNCLPLAFYTAAILFLAKERSDKSEEMMARQVRRFFVASARNQAERV